MIDIIKNPRKLKNIFAREQIYYPNPVVANLFSGM
jgi:hypothetical protein